MVVFRQSVLLLVLWAMAWPLGTLADKRMASTERRGRHLLLGKNTDAKTHTEPHIPWGKGIWLMLPHPHKCSVILGIKEYFVIYKISQIIGPVYCFQSNPKLNVEMKMYWQQNFDILASPMYITEESNNEDTAFLYPHVRNNLFLVVKKIQPQRQSIMQSFTPTTWAATCLGVAIFWLALRLADRRKMPLEALRTFLFGSFFESRRPIPNFLSLIFSIFSVIMITAFCSKLMTFLVVMKEPPQPQTLKEAEARVTRMYFTLRTGRRYESTDVLYNLRMKSVPHKGYVEPIKDTLASTQSAYFGAESIQDDLETNSILINQTTGRVLTYYLHMVPEFVTSPAFQAYHVRHSWPHRERFSALLQRALEAGIVTKLISDCNAFRVNVGWRVRDIPPSDDPEPFTMANMLEAFVVLGAGVAVSIAAFAGELALCKWRRWRKERQRRTVRRSSQAVHTP